ncbi:MAG: inositol monophosphatase [Ignavibacteria bacterium]|nr:inositol monophosphatase [Ignavibacteria bacterium]
MVELAIEAAREAGRLLRLHIGRPRDIEVKLGQETNLVTDADKKAEKTIIRVIKSRYPSHDFLAEESGLHNQVSDYRWIIDPLDGTTNFAHGVPIFCVSIALEHKGRIILGVVYDPNLDELFVAERGRGAFVNSRPIRVSKTSLLRESLLVTGFPYNIADNPDRAIERFVAFLKEARAVRRLGSAALDLCYVAAGRFDGFWEVFLNPWDMAAGVLLVEEAGGTFTDFRGHPSSVYDKQVLTSNGLIHDSMIRVLKQVGEQPRR